MRIYQKIDHSDVFDTVVDCLVELFPEGGAKFWDSE